MGPFQELLATDHRQTLEFFIVGLRDVSEPTVDPHELLYNASVLAHYAQVSTHAGLEWPAPANLSEVFDQFVSNTALRLNGLMMEVAATQCLVMAGFFEDQMRQRHNIRWYAELRGFLQPSGRARKVLAQSSEPRRDRPALRTMASTARAPEPRVARRAVSPHSKLTARASALIPFFHTCS
jgi:hypothetical protein